MEIKFDETLHKYTVDGKEVISVTQLLQKHRITPSYDAVDKELLRVASERGTLIHEEVENWIKNNEKGFTEEAERICDYLNSNADRDSRIISEQIVANDIVAGRFDVLYTHAKNLVLTDIKTGNSKHLYGWSWQLSLYKYLYEKMYGQKIESLIVLWPRNGGMDVIPCGYVGDDKIENLLNAEREGRLISDVDLGVSEEELEDLEELIQEIEIKEYELKQMKEKVDKVKETLYSTMEKEGVKTVDRNKLKITYVAPSTRTSIDSKKLQKEEPEIYKKYVNTTTVAGSIKITLMGEKKNG